MQVLVQNNIEKSTHTYAFKCIFCCLWICAKLYFTLISAKFYKSFFMVVGLSQCVDYVDDGLVFFAWYACFDNSFFLIFRIHLNSLMLYFFCFAY